MSQVVSFSDYKPAARYDDTPWTHVKVEEAVSADGPWTLIDTLTLDPVDADPAKPLSRNLTIENGSDTPDLWYRLTTVDDAGATGRPSDPIQNLAPLTLVEATLYIQPDQLKSTLSIKASSSDTSYLDADVLSSCRAASRAVDKLCDRFFYRLDLSNDEVRTFTTWSPRTVELDDLTGVSQVRFDRDDDGTYEITLAATDYVLGPTKAPNDGAPWEWLRLRTGKSWMMPVGIDGGIEVTGRFGWLEVPAQVKDAATIIAAKLLKRKREAPFSIVGVGLDNVAVRIGSNDAEVQMLLQPFDRRRWVA